MGTLRFFEEVVSFKIRRTFGFADYKVSVSKETHDKVAMIVRWLGDGEVTIADFTENVLSEFFRTHRDELNRMLNALPRVEL